MSSHHPHHARKRFGQHFLTDDFVLQRLTAAIAPQPNEHLVEIGPGKGALTALLVPLVKQLDLIEIDRDLVSLLKQQFTNQSNVQIHEADAITFDLKTIITNDKRLRVVGNLPYNISTPLLFRLIAQLEYIEDMHFMVQKEVAERLTATVSSSKYGRLSVMSQYYCDNELLFLVEPDSFNPPPKVDSAVIQMQPTSPKITAKNLNTLDHIVKGAFTYRRKTISNALKNIIPTKLLEKLQINPKLRPQDIPIEDYVRISNAIDVE